MSSTLQSSDLSVDLMVNMLDGELGAVTDPTTAGITPAPERACWCGCTICFMPPDDDYTTDRTRTV